MGIKLKLRPALQNMYTCHDKQSGYYGLPFSCANDKMAIRAFQIYCYTDEEGKINASHLELYKCGTFNRDTGLYQNTKLKLIAKGDKYAISNILREKSQNIPANGQ